MEGVCVTAPSTKQIAKVPLRGDSGRRAQIDETCNRKLPLHEKSRLSGDLEYKLKNKYQHRLVKHIYPQSVMSQKRKFVETHSIKSL